jgi:hypothetical protein
MPMSCRRLAACSGGGPSARGGALGRRWREVVAPERGLRPKAGGERVRLPVRGKSAAGRIVQWMQVHLFTAPLNQQTGGRPLDGPLLFY